MSITPIAHDELAAAVAVLVGQPFQRGMRVRDTEVFEFGVVKPWTGDLTIVLDDESRLRSGPATPPSSGGPDGSHVVVEHDGPTLAAS